MAQILGEFDTAFPSSSGCCKRISLVDYERQGADETHHELEKLLQYLDSNPGEYIKTLRKRKRDELNLFSQLKVKVMTAVQGEQYLGSYFPEEECNTELDCLKNDLISAYNYGQEGNGRRFSKRLVAKAKITQAEQVDKTPAIPRPPPPPVIHHPSPHSTDKNIEDIENRKPANNRKLKSMGLKRNSSSRLNSINDELFLSLRSVSGRGHAKKSPKQVDDNAPEIYQSKLKTMKKSRSKKFSKSSHQKNLNDEIANARKKLKCINIQNTPGGTPYQHSKQKRQGKSTSDQYPMFNVALVHKFRNTRSPSSSPSGCFNDSTVSFGNDSLENK